jgi:mycoredoxin
MSKQFLDEHGIEYTYINLEDDPDAAEKVMELNGGMQSVPTLVFDDGSVLTEPSNEELKEKIDAGSL